MSGEANRSEDGDRQEAWIADDGRSLCGTGYWEPDEETGQGPDGKPDQERDQEHWRSLEKKRGKLCKDNDCIGECSPFCTEAGH